MIKRTNVFWSGLIDVLHTTTSLAVLYSGTAMLMVGVLLVMHEGAGHEEGIGVELRDALRNFRTWREAVGLDAGQAERLVADVGVGAEVGYGFGEIVVLVGHVVLVSVGRLVKMEELLAHCHALLAVTGPHELFGIAAISRAKQHFTIIVRRNWHLQLSLYVGIWSITNSKPSQTSIIGQMKRSWVKPIDVLHLGCTHQLRSIGIIGLSVLLLFV